MKLNKLQNSIFHIRHTVLQLIDRQCIAETHLSEPAPSCSIPRSKTPIAQFGGARDTPFFIFRHAKIFAHRASQPDNAPHDHSAPPTRVTTQHTVQSGEVPAATNIHHSGKMKNNQDSTLSQMDRTKGMTKSQSSSPEMNIRKQGYRKTRKRGLINIFDIPQKLEKTFGNGISLYSRSVLHL